MKKRWLLNLILFCVVAGLVAFLYLRPKPGAESNVSYEVSNYKLADFNAISIEFPAQAAVTFKKTNNFWYFTAPYQTRADQASVQRIMSIIAAKSTTKIVDTDLEKFGLNQPSIKLKLIKTDNTAAEFLFGTHNPVNDEQYVLHNNAIYLLDNGYAEAAAAQTIEMVDKSPLKPTEKVAGFDFSHLEQWEDTRLNLDMLDGKWKVSIANAKPQQDELNEWLDFSWIHNPAKSVEFYTPDRKKNYPYFVIKMQDGSKVHVDKIQESPDLILARPDEGLMYYFASDAGFTMLNPPINLPTK